MTNDHSTLDSGAESDMDRCREYVIYTLEERKRRPTHGRQPPGGPAITIAYETGSGAHEVARRLAAILQAGEPKGSGPWTVFDRQLVQKVLEEHHLPQRLAKFMPEDRRRYIQDVLEELVGLRPPSWVLVPKITASILHLADAGHVILVGRGASAVTARMPNVFHVRLIASLAGRVQRVQQLENLSPAEAGKFIASSDRGRGRYVSAYFHTRVDDDLQYHLVLNTDRIPPPEAAELIADGAHRCFQGANMKQLNTS
jgi:Cytidylate kinase-like family